MALLVASNIRAGRAHSLLPWDVLYPTSPRLRTLHISFPIFMTSTARSLSNLLRADVQLLTWPDDCFLLGSTEFQDTMHASPGSEGWKLNGHKIWIVHDGFKWLSFSKCHSDVERRKEECFQNGNFTLRSSYHLWRWWSYSASWVDLAQQKVQIPLIQSLTKDLSFSYNFKALLRFPGAFVLQYCNNFIDARTIDCSQTTLLTGYRHKCPNVTHVHFFQFAKLFTKNKNKLPLL